MYYKGKWCTAGGKDPLFGHVDGFQIDHNLFSRLGKQIRRLKKSVPGMAHSLHLVRSTTDSTVVSYYFLIKILILIRKASPEGAASFVIYKERNHKTSLI